MIKSIQQPGPTTVSVELDKRENDQHVGIIIGLSIGLCCIIACLLSIVCKKRCSKQASSVSENTRSDSGCRQNLTTETHEMEMYTGGELTSETLSPPPLPPPGSQHIDSKVSRQLTLHTHRTSLSLTTHVYNRGTIRTEFVCRHSGTARYPTASSLAEPFTSLRTRE